MSKEEVLVSLEEGSGELRMIHEAMCNISDPLSEEYQRLSKEYGIWHARVMEDIDKLAAIEKLEQEQINREESAKSEHKWKKIDTGVKVGLGVLSAVGTFGSLVYDWFKYDKDMDKGLEFEKTGTYTSTTTRGLFKRTPRAKR